MELVIVDTSQIQPYVFGSNRLRENIGASYLVAQATGDWATGLVPKDQLVYAGGGNVVAHFPGDSAAQAFVRQLSKQALMEAPNLQLVIAHRPAKAGESLYQAVQETFKKLAEEKNARPHAAPLLGLGVTMMCRSTGLPAMDKTQPIKGDSYPASAEILAKLDVATKRGPQPSLADERLHNYLPAPDGYDYPSDFDDLGRAAGEHSFIAVVHADGNDMGEQVKAIGKQHQNDDQEYKKAIGQFSEGVKKATEIAWQKTLDKLTERLAQHGGEAIRHYNANGERLAEVVLKEIEGKQGFYLPFRPIVYGGDDVTFVCDGRLGLSMALEYLRQFEEQTATLPGGQLTACAGVAIVKSHYPFAQAYKLAEKLCREAKNFRRKKNLEGSCLDWHFALSGLSGDIKTIRQREYTVPQGSLTLRPVSLDKVAGHSQCSWPVIQAGVNIFQDMNLKPDEKPHWSTRRNKVKALRDVLREGPEAVCQFRVKFNEGKQLPDVESSMTNWPDEGWQGGLCGYFDALELLDWFIPL